MALTQTQQLQKLIDDARHVLVTFRKHASGDAIASALAVASFLTSQGKVVDVVSEQFLLPKKFRFLPGAKDITALLPHLQKFMITVDIQDAGVEELTYDIKDKKLHIFVTPKSGFLTKEHIRTAQSEFRHDLIITINTPDLESLGSVYKKNSDIFYSLPVINIDHELHNEHYGTTNVIDVTASATAEVVANTLIDLGGEQIDDELATSLLTGMIANTQSFKADNIRPKTLALASKLVSMGANREYIIKHLYQTKTLSMLRLWGQALAHMDYHKDIGLVSSRITRDDFIRSGASEDELYDIIDELIINSPEEHMTLLLHEHVGEKTGQVIHGIFHVEKGLNAKQLLDGIDIHGNQQQVSFMLHDTSLAQAEEMIIERIRKNRL